MVQLAGLLADRGYAVSLVTYASLPDHYDTPEGVKRIDIGKTRIKRGKISAIIRAFKVFRYFLRVKTDCIIAYRECANLRVLPPLFFRRKKIRVICSDRNTSTFLSFRHRLLLFVLYRRADFIVPNSNAQREFILRNNPGLKSKTHTIHNYTDLRQFCETDIPSDISRIKIAVFSRYSEQKNPIGLALAISELKKRSAHPFEIHWYGDQNGDMDGYNEDYLKIRTKIDSLCIDDVLKLHPPIKNPATIMSAFHACCLASFFEGFSNSVAEGICCGKPMLVSNVSDNPVMVHNGVNGYLFNPNDIQSICDAFMCFFTLSYDKMCKMGKESRKIAEDLFDEEQFMQQYINLIES